MRIGFLIAVCCLASSALADCPPLPIVTSDEKEARALCRGQNLNPQADYANACKAFAEREEIKWKPVSDCISREREERDRIERARQLELINRAGTALQ